MGQTIASGSALGGAASGLGSGSSSPSVARPPASKGLPLSTIATAPSVPLPSSSLRHETLLRSEIHEPKKEGELGAVNFNNMIPVNKLNRVMVDGLGG